MQQSDQLLLTSLKDFISIPSHITNLKAIKSQQLFTISLSILEFMSIDTSQIKSIQKQKFKSMTKLNQKLFKELQIELQLNDLLNPTLAFVRKTLLIYLAKIGSNDHNQISSKYKQEESYEKIKRKKNVKNWLEDQWIHPQLLQKQNFTTNQYAAYKYPLTINRKTIKSNIIPNIFKSSIVKNNSMSILSNAINQNLIKQKQEQKNAGILRKNQQNFGVSVSSLIASNFQEWNMAEQKLNKIKRKIQKDKQALQIKQAQIIKDQKNEVVSVFQVQLETKIQQKQKQKEIIKQSVLSSIPTQATQIASDSSDNPLQKLKKQAQNKKKHYQILIQELLVQLNQKKQQLFNVENAKNQFDKKIQADEQKIIIYKTKKQELKKEVQKKQLVLNSIQSSKPIQEQIKKYEQDIKQIDSELKNQVTKINQAIQVIKNQSDKKILALNDLKLKLNRIQVQYRQVCQQIQQKSSLKGKIKINKSGISRVYYSKKIGQIDKRWKQTKKQVIRIKKDLQILNQKTTIITKTSDIMQRDIINIIQADKNKNEPQSKALRDIFMKCQNCFKNTLCTLQKINQVKQQTRQYEVKLHALTSQNYKAGIQKLNNSLIQLKKQIQQNSRKSKV